MIGMMLLTTALLQSLVTKSVEFLIEAPKSPIKTKEDIGDDGKPSTGKNETVFDEKDINLVPRKADTKNGSAEARKQDAEKPRTMKVAAMDDRTNRATNKLKYLDVTGNPLAYPSKDVCTRGTAHIVAFLREEANKGGTPKGTTDQIPTSPPFFKQDAQSRRAITSVLMVSDAYGTSQGGTTAMNRQVAQFLTRHGATVHSTALQASEEDKKCAKEDGVILHLPVQTARNKRAPSLEWLTDYHSIHYPDIPQDLDCIVGHVDVTSGAAKSIQENRCRHAKLVLFNHDMPEDTEHYKGAEKAMAVGKKVGDILEDTKNADAVFSLGRRIFDHFETKYKSLGDSEPKEHLMFLPRPSATFEAISVRPGGGQKTVLTAGRVTEVEKLKGHDLAARAMGEVAEKIPNVTLRVRLIDEDDWEASKKILEENLQSGRIKPTLLRCGTQKDIAQDMQQAHLVLMPSRAEPFGMIGLEAIAAGIPVLISDKSGLADMIKDLIKKKKCPSDMRYRIVETSVRESDLAENAREWAKKITDTLEYSESEFEKAVEFKKELLESKYWEESYQNLLRVFGLMD
ncbi:Hypp3606 [Branchiostoma lanceolatum]|uniref:Hypp3606 protein n=1 Tax=Branchiostoma lanceolatum TaxID=7740 RepID=A0A8K0ESA5_BRALA|nr:Hypp3606 [Branchiostoma lanceolatum]